MFDTPQVSQIIRPIPPPAELYWELLNYWHTEWMGSGCYRFLSAQIHLFWESIPKFRIMGIIILLQREEDCHNPTAEVCFHNFTCTRSTWSSSSLIPLLIPARRVAPPLAGELFVWYKWRVQIPGHLLLLLIYLPVLPNWTVSQNSQKSMQFLLFLPVVSFPCTHVPQVLGIRWKCEGTWNLPLIIFGQQSVIQVVFVIHFYY